ncbi:MAG: hypothetical protein M0R03_00550 [Novosphingobium sp.]|nr:hypothetical protein [Novosphingobium sp.]
MSGNIASIDWAADPENIQVPVRADCGHIFPVAVARMLDGGEFTCLVCGATDRFDEEALRVARQEVAGLREKNGANSFTSLIDEVLAKAPGGKAPSIG